MGCHICAGTSMRQSAALIHGFNSASSCFMHNLCAGPAPEAIGNPILPLCKCLYHALSTSLFNWLPCNYFPRQSVLESSAGFAAVFPFLLSTAGLHSRGRTHPMSGIPGQSWER